jgi:hypothetical protein
MEDSGTKTDHRGATMDDPRSRTDQAESMKEDPGSFTHRPAGRRRQPHGKVVGKILETMLAVRECPEFCV